LSLSRFAADLKRALDGRQLPVKVRSEQRLESKFIVPVAAQIAGRHPEILLYAHPFRKKACCSPHCVTKAPGGEGRIVGCPKCWAASKAWASVAAFGTHHTFDLVAKDGRRTLALEAKWGVVKGHQMPNGQLQRFLGQCALAAAKHDVVIGVFAYRGRLNAKWRRDTKAALSAFRAQGVHLVFRAVK
jgi:hypothetical protein